MFVHIQWWILLVGLSIACTEGVTCPKVLYGDVKCDYLVGGRHDDGAPYCLCAGEIAAVESGSNTSIIITTWPPLNSTVELNIAVEPIVTLLAPPLVAIGPYDSNETVTVVTMEAVRRGKSFFKFTNQSEALFVNLNDVVRQANVVHFLFLNVLADVVGWMYFAAWTFSYYPQPILNCYRRSVIGLNIDYVVLSVIGYIGYLVFNLCLYFSTAIQDQYFLRHPGGVNQVQLSDVAYSIHSMILSSIVLLQVVFLRRGNQKLSKTNKVILILIFLAIYVCLLLSVGNTVMQWLDFLYAMSYVKLFINLIKDLPQLWQIYRTKTTAGYSMLGIWIDLAGGVFSLLQMFILAYNYDDWASFFGDPTKFGVGVFSILTDFVVMYQHYILYGSKENDKKARSFSWKKTFVRVGTFLYRTISQLCKRKAVVKEDINEQTPLIN